MAQFARYTTDGVALRDRPAQWDAALWSAAAPFRTSPADSAFVGDASYGTVGPLRLLRIAASAHRLERAEGSARAHVGLVKLVVQRSGTATVAQAGRQALLEPGHWALCDADRAFAITSEAEGEQIILFMPRERLGGGSGLPAYFARRFGETGGTARLLPHYLASLTDEIARVDEGNCGELADMAAQLVRLALLEARHAAPPVSMRETLRLRVKDYVRRNLRDPGLTIDRVATAFGCTKRHLHKVFNDDTLTLSHFIWSQRLEACRDALLNPQLARRSITEIAFMWGFNNSAHFSKAFKERFGVSPGQFRGKPAQPAPMISRVERPANLAPMDDRAAA